VLTRILTGLVLAPLVGWLIVAGPQIGIHVVVALAGGLAARELVRMFPVAQPRDVVVTIVLSTLVAASPALPGNGAIAVWMVCNAFAIAVTLRNPGDLKDAAHRAALIVLSTSYVGGMAAAMNGIVVHVAPVGDGGPIAFGRGALIMVFVIVFAGDTGAYFSGRAFGRHKLNPLISPKKTIEGTIGGLLASTAGAYLCARYLVPQIPVLHALALGVFCGGFAQVGDLAESLFKRATDTKDSGALLPGHGGMLDRIDGVLFGAPVFYAYLMLAT
jgi:phosphatidate cytidylyltransferase